MGIENAEAANVAALDIAAKRGRTEDETPRAVRLLQENGIKAVGGFIVGNPDDDRAAIARTFRYARRLGLDFPIVQCLTPYPRTEMRAALVAEGLVTNPDDLSRYNGYVANVRTRHLSSAAIARAMLCEGLKLYFDPQAARRRRCAGRRPGAPRRDAPGARLLPRPHLPDRPGFVLPGTSRARRRGRADAPRAAGRRAMPRSGVRERLHAGLSGGPRGLRRLRGEPAGPGALVAPCGSRGAGRRLPARLRERRSAHRPAGVRRARPLRGRARRSALHAALPRPAEAARRSQVGRGLLRAEPRAHERGLRADGVRGARPLAAPATGRVRADRCLRDEPRRLRRGTARRRRASPGLRDRDDPRRLAHRPRLGGADPSLPPSGGGGTRHHV